MMFRLENLFAFGKFLRFLLHNTSDVTRGEGAQFPGAESLRGAKKSQVISTFFKTVHLLPKDLRFEHGGVKFVSCPTRHLTSFRLCTMHITIVYLAKMAKFVYKNTCPSVANYQSQNF